MVNITNIDGNLHFLYVVPPPCRACTGGTHRPLENEEFNLAF
jgi:hypothetical protein